MEIKHTLLNYDNLFSCFVLEGNFHFSGKENRHDVWKESDYRLGVCRVTNGAHIEHLQGIV